MMIRKFSFVVILVASLIYSAGASGLVWDNNTISLHHFDLDSIYAASYDGFNVSLDQSEKIWYGLDEASGSGPMFSGAYKKFGDYSMNVSSNRRFVLVPSTEAYNDFNFNTTGNWTMEFWIYPYSPQGALTNGSIIDWRSKPTTSTKSTAYNGSYIYMNASNSVSIANPANGVFLLGSSSPIPMKTWSHVAFSKNQSKLRVWVNGALNGTTDSASNYNWSAPKDYNGISDYGVRYVIGNDGVTYNPINTGSTRAYIDEVRISNVSRYNSPFFGSSFPTEEFFDPVNKSAIFYSIPQDQAFVGSTAVGFVSYSNISYTDNIFEAGGNSTALSFISITNNESQPAMYYGSTPFTSTSYNGYNSIAQYTDLHGVTESGSSVVYDFNVSFDRIGDGYVKGISIPNVGDNTGLYPTYGGINYNGSSAMYTSQAPHHISQSTPQQIVTIFDPSNVSAMLGVCDNSGFDFGFGEESTVKNVGQTVNITLCGYDTFVGLNNINGIVSSINYNKTLWNVTNVISSDPRYDVSALIVQGSGYVNLTANYPQYGGITTNQSNAQYYLTVQFVPQPAASANKPSTALDIHPSVLSSYTAGNPFEETLPYTYSSTFSWLGNITFSITDDYVTSTFHAVDINSEMPITSLMNVSYDARDATPVSPIQTDTGAFSFTHRGGTFKLEVEASGYFDYDREYTIGETGDHTIYLTPLSGVSDTKLNTLYLHETTFKFINRYGVPVRNATITATIDETSIGGTNWLSTLYGVSDQATDIDTTVLTGTTDYNGVITFPVYGAAKYSLNIVEPTTDVSETIELYPSLTEYVIIVTSSAVQLISSEQSGDYINGTLHVTGSGSTINLNLTYSDESLTTDNVTFYVNYPNASRVFTKQILGTTENQSFVTGYTVNNVAGQGYVFGFAANSTKFGNISKDQGITLKGVDGVLIDIFTYKDRW